MIILKKNSRGLLQGGWGGCGRYSWTEGKMWRGKHNKSRRFRRAASNGPPISASCLPHLPFLQLYPRTRHFFFLHCTSYIWILNHAGLKEPNKLGCICAWSVMFDSVTPRIVAYQAPQSMGFSRQAYWIGLPFPPPEDLPYPGIKPGSPALAGKFFTTEPPGNPNLAEMWLKIGRPKERIIRTPWNWGRSS